MYKFACLHVSMIASLNVVSFLGPQNKYNDSRDYFSHNICNYDSWLYLIVTFQKWTKIVSLEFQPHQNFKFNLYFFLLFFRISTHARMVPAGAGALLIVGSFKKRVPDPDFKVSCNTIISFSFFFFIFHHLVIGWIYTFLLAFWTEIGMKNLFHVADERLKREN